MRWDFEDIPEIIFVGTACSEQNIVVTTSVLCMCLRCALVCASVRICPGHNLHICSDIKIMWHSCFPKGVEVPFKPFAQVG